MFIKENNQIELAEKEIQLYKKVEKVELKSLLPNLNFADGLDHAIVDEFGNVLNVCSKKYNLVPNSDVFLPIEDKIKSSGLLYTKKVNIINNSKFYVDYIIKDELKSTQVNDVFPKISIWNSYDGTLKFRREFGFFRLVCSNGLAVPFGLSNTILNKHTTDSFDGFDKSSLNKFVNGFIESTNFFLNKTKEHTKFYEFLNEKGANIKTLEKIAEETNLSKRIIETATDRYKFETESQQLVFNDLLNNQRTTEKAERSLFTVYNALNFGIYNTNEKELPERKLEKDIKVIEYIQENYV